MAEGKFSEAGFDATYNKKESIKYGLILGVISLVLGVIILKIIPHIDDLISSIIFSKVVNDVFYALIALYFALKLRKANGGFWNFTIALKSIFVMLLVGVVISYLGNEIYCQLIEPGIQVDNMHHSMNLMIESLESANKEPEIIDSKIVEYEKAILQLENKTFYTVLRGITISILLQFIFSLILAALTRNEKLPPRIVNNN